MFYSLALILDLWSSLSYIWYKLGIFFHFFECEYPIVLEQFVLKNVLSHTEWSRLPYQISIDYK